MPKSLLHQFSQVNGTKNFFTDMRLPYAELSGRHYTTGTVTIVSGSNLVTDTTPTTFLPREVDNFIIVDNGPAAGVYHITSVSGVVATVTPTPTSNAEDVTARRHYYQNLEDDLNYIRKQLNSITGETNWYDSPETNLSELANLEIVADAYSSISDGVNTATASGASTLTVIGGGGVSITVDPITDSLTISGSGIPESYNRNLTYVSDYIWEYNGGFTAVPDGLAVYINGNYQKPNDIDYYTTAIVSGSLQITFGFMVHPDEDWASITYGSTYPGIHQWGVHTSNYEAVIGDRVMVDSTLSGDWTITLPSAPSFGATVTFLDVGGNCSTNKVIIGHNGKNIMGLAEDLNINTDGASFDLIYYNAIRGWVIS